MAKNRDDYVKEGREMFARGQAAPVFFSWQERAKLDGWNAAQQEAASAAAVQVGKTHAAEKFQFPEKGGLVVFPARMPQVVCEHIRELNQEAVHTSDSTKALRLDRKISKLYGRYA